jgi:hypothetical protein
MAASNMPTPSLLLLTHLLGCNPAETVASTTCRCCLREVAGDLDAVASEQGGQAGNALEVLGHLHRYRLVPDANHRCRPCDERALKCCYMSLPADQ